MRSVTPPPLSPSIDRDRDRAPPKSDATPRADGAASVGITPPGDKVRGPARSFAAAASAASSSSSSSSSRSAREHGSSACSAATSARTSACDSRCESASSISRTYGRIAGGNMHANDAANVPPPPPPWLPLPRPPLPPAPPRPPPPLPPWPWPFEFELEFEPPPEFEPTPAPAPDSPVSRRCNLDKRAGVTAAASSSSASPAAPAWTSREVINSANQRVFSRWTPERSSRVLAAARDATCAPSCAPSSPAGRSIRAIVGVEFKGVRWS